MEPDELQQRRYTAEEVGELIETATRLDQLRSDAAGMTIDDVRRVAAELGISESALKAALRQENEERRAAERAEARRREEAAEEEVAAAARRDAWAALKAHLASYLGVIGGLAVIDLATGGGLDWVVFPAAGWGIGILIHFFTVLFGVAEEDDQDGD